MYIQSKKQPTVLSIGKEYTTSETNTHRKRKE